MSAALRLGISPCPNDTFAFHGLLADRVDRRGLELSIELADIEALNQALRAGELDVAKGSFFAALDLADELCVLASGSALGFGVGPVLLAPRPGVGPEDFERRHGRRPRVLCPGAGTTAHLLFRLLHPSVEGVEHVVFSDIMPALEEGRADFGVCIHEGRFTYAARGLALVEDLGESWERRARAPLPLGGLLAKKRLGREGLSILARVVRDSLDYGRAHRAEALGTMRRHAQELAEDVLWSHVELYVNDWTRDLGAEGGRALTALSEAARSAQLVAPGRTAIEVVHAFEEPPRLFHLAPSEAWSERLPGSPWTPASLAQEGFVHLSFASQLPGTLEEHFGELSRVTLVEVAPAGTPELARSRGGALFPHLRSPIRPAEIVHEWPLARAGAGFCLPAL